MNPQRSVLALVALLLVSCSGSFTGSQRASPGAVNAAKQEVPQTLSPEGTSGLDAIIATG